MRSNLTDFALGTLAAGIGASDLSFSLQPGDGARFPAGVSSVAGPFVVAIDSELLLCSAKSGDTFTVWSDSSGHTGRGYTTATAAGSGHSAGAPVVLSDSTALLYPLWGATPDAHMPDVPPYARGHYNSTTGLWDYWNSPVAPGTPDDEFEWFWVQSNGSNTQNSWSWAPWPASLGGSNGGATISVGSPYRSCVSFTRADFDVTTWWMWKPVSFTPGSVYSIACKLSQGGRVYGDSPNPSPPAQQVSFFLSDQASFSASNNDPGTMVRLTWQTGRGTLAGVDPLGGSHNFYSDWIGVETDNNGTYASQQWMPIAAGSPLYLKLTNNGGDNSVWLCWIGDGYTWRSVAQVTGLPFQPQSVGFRFLSTGNNSRTQQTVVIDWLRTVL